MPDSADFPKLEEACQIKMGSDEIKKKNDQNIILRIRHSYLLIFLCSLPLTATILCILLSIVNDFDASTRTHCGVSNYLPTVSAAIGGFTPQRYIWRIFIGAHIGPRLAVPFYYISYFSKFPMRYDITYMCSVYFMGMMGLIELLALLTLTSISSSENSDIHENSFIAFMTCSLLYMLMQIIILRWSRNWKTLLNHIARKSFRHKTFYCITNLSIFFLSLYYYFRHNTHCEPGIYSRFAMCEYIVIFTNIMYHATMRFDMPDGYITYSFPMPKDIH